MRKFPFGAELRWAALPLRGNREFEVGECPHRALHDTRLEWRFSFGNEARHKRRVDVAIATPALAFPTARGDALAGAISCVVTGASRRKEIQLEQYLVRVEDENLLETDGGDDVDAMLEAVSCESCQELLVARAPQSHVMQRAGRPGADLAIVGPRALEAVDVDDGTAGGIVHPARILVSQRWRAIARLEAEELRVEADAALEIAVMRFT